MKARSSLFVAAPMALVVMAALAAWQVSAADDPQVAAPAKAALTVKLVSPLRAALPQSITANGSVAAWQEASVGTEANGLRLAEVLVNVGDSVRRDQVLARFAPQTVQADLAQAQAALSEAQAQVGEASANAQRARELQDSGALSAQQISQYLTAERTAQARREAAQAQVQMQALRLQQTEVRAPDAGVISARSATVGAVLPAGQELFRLIRQHRLEWRAEVAAADLVRLKPGLAVRVTPAGGATVEGRVRMVAPSVDPQTRNGLVYVDLPSPGATRAGMFARGEFVLGQSEGWTLPATAVLLREGFHYVLAVDAQSRVALTKVSIGRRSGDRIEITSTIDPKLRVVATGGGFLGDGDLVRVVDGGRS